MAPLSDITHITFEAYYSLPVLFPTNGNILLDNCSPIWPVADTLDLSDIPNLDTYDVVTHDSIRLAYAEKLKNDRLKIEIEQKEAQVKRKKAKTIAFSKDIIVKNKITNLDKYPLLSTIDAIEAFFYHTDNYMMKSYFKGKSYVDLEELQLSMLEIGTIETAEILSQALDIYFLYGQSHRMTTTEKKAFESLDESIEVAKAQDDLWVKIERFIIENLDSFEEENEIFKNR